MLANLVDKRQLTLETQGFQLPCLSTRALPCQRRSSENFEGTCYGRRWKMAPTCETNILLQSANELL